MTRMPNIRTAGDYRRDKYNPLFDLITGEFDDNFKERSYTIDQILEKLYVDNRLEESVTNEQILRLFTMSEAAIVTGLDDFITDLVEMSRTVYLLLGKKGIGKTMLVCHFAKQAHAGHIDGISQDDMVLYLDLKNRRNDKQFKDDLPSSLTKLMLGELTKRGNPFRRILLEPTKLRTLHPLFKNISDDGELLKRVHTNPDEAISFFLDWMGSHNHKSFLIVDNLDDFDSQSIKTIYDKCDLLKTDFAVRCIIALRDWWTPHRLNIGDRLVCGKHLSKPNVYEVMKKRIYAVNTTRITGSLSFFYGDEEVTLSPTDILQIFHDATRELAHSRYTALLNEILRMCNHNLREFLLNMYHFFHSPYLLVKPNIGRVLAQRVKEVDPDADIESYRELHLHDFLENFMAVHSLCYDIQDSRIFNLFHHDYGYEDGPNYKNVLILVRILQVVGAVTGGRAKSDVTEILQSVGYTEAAIIDALQKLLAEALIESVDGIDIEDVTEVMLSTKGDVYLNELAGEYNYLLFVSDAVPMEEEYRIDVDSKFGTEEYVVSRGNLQLKNDSVKEFLRFIEANEDQEEESCSPQCVQTLRRIRGGAALADRLWPRVNEAISRMSWASVKHKQKRASRFRLQR